MSHSISEQLRFAPAEGFTIRADFNGGGLSSDLGPLLLRGVDYQIGLTARIMGALNDKRHPGYIKHSMNVVAPCPVPQNRTLHPSNCRIQNDRCTKVQMYQGPMALAMKARKIKSMVPKVISKCSIPYLSLLNNERLPLGDLRSVYRLFWGSGHEYLSVDSSANVLSASCHNGHWYQLATSV